MFSQVNSTSRKIRTLVAEDSTTVRRMLVSILSSDPDFEVVGEASDGVEAVKKAAELKPDLITMDINMPLLDGIDATKVIMRDNPIPILVVTSAGNDNVELSLNAVHAGALMIVDKPTDPLSDQFLLQRDQLLVMAKAMAGVKVVRRWGREGGKHIVTPTSSTLPKLIAIGASAGGPAALRRVFLDLPRHFPVPIVVVQHIAHGFIDGLARWLGQSCVLPVKVVSDKEEIEASTIYLAPDDHHVGISSLGVAHLSSDPPINGFRPSVDYLFDSCGQAYGASVIGVILSGMGNDGSKGLETIHSAGGKVLAQDEASSIVFGMANEALKRGVVDEVLHIERIGSRLTELVTTT